MIRILGALVSMFISLSLSAAPVEIDASLAVSRFPRYDNATGLCGYAASITSANQPLATLIPVATMGNLLAQPVNGMVEGYKVAQKDNKNYRIINLRDISKLGEGDFSGASYTKETLPFNPNPQAQTILKLVGYLNVTTPLEVTLGVLAQSAHSLFIGQGDKKILLTSSPLQQEVRITKQVKFNAVGIYPVELWYQQGAKEPALEWSLATGFLSEGPQSKPLDLNSYVLLGDKAPNFAIFTAQAGQSSCQSCTTTQNCAAGEFCQDTLCAPCLTSNHCGTSCQACPNSAPICKGKNAQEAICVTCNTDEDCLGICNAGKCEAGVSCKTDFDCNNVEGRTLCHDTKKLCVAKSEMCTDNSNCGAGYQCADKKCKAITYSCNLDTDCPENWACDNKAKVCRTLPQGYYTGGSGCSISAQRSTPINMGLGLVLILIASVGFSYYQRRKVHLLSS